jgi:AcrR family transcriptional regulator
MRRTQAQRTEGTVAALVEAARELFARDGFESTSLDAVAARAGVSKGAVYHHFVGKRQLYRAVFAREVEAMTAPVTQAYVRKSDPWAAFEEGSRAFLSECLKPDVQRIVLLDAFAAIGWEEMRTLESPLLELMEIGVARAIDAGQIAPRPVAPLVHFLFGALCETAMVVARSENQRAAHEDALTEIGQIFRALSVS